MVWLLLFALAATLLYVVREATRVRRVIRAPAVGRAKAERLEAQAKQLERDEPGGDARNAVEIESPAVVEAYAQNRRCSRCEGALEVSEHRIEFHDTERLRVADTRCRGCGRERPFYFRLQPRVLN